jgi:hypothetical protein
MTTLVDISGGVGNRARMVPFGFGDPRRTRPAHVQGFAKKRLMVSGSTT